MTVEELQKDLLFDIAQQFMTAEVPREDYQSVAQKVVDLVAAVRADVNAGKQEAWVIAIQDGFHWRFIGVPTYVKRECAPPDEHAVRILFDGPDPKGEAAQNKMIEAFTKSVDDIMVQSINFRPDKVRDSVTDEINGEDIDPTPD